MGFVTIILAAFATASTFSTVLGATLRSDMSPRERNEILELRDEGMNCLI